MNMKTNVSANALASWNEFLPYQLSSNRFVNPNSFQIICAGRDGCFGTGGINWAGFNAGKGNADAYGYDNFSNFHQTLMGIPAQ